MTFPWSDGSDIAFTPVGIPKTQVCTLLTPAEAAAVEAENEPQLTEEEVKRLLNGDLSVLNPTAGRSGLVAAGDDQTGAMIALLPTIADQERLAVSGGEDEEELHLTLFYLGDAAKITPDVRDRIVRMMGRLAQEIPIIDADGFNIATFNPEKPDKETCVTLGCSGIELKVVHDRVAADISDGIDMWRAPEQHQPWTPHVTLAYSNDSSLPAQLVDRTGPIRFDVLRVAFAEQATDFPLYDGTVTAAGDHWRTQDRDAQGKWTDDPASAVAKVASKALKTGPLTKANETALAEYSSLTGYVDINDRLRTGAVPSYLSHETLDETIAQIRDSMRPLPNDQTVFRGVSVKQFSGITDVSQLPDLVGETFRDEGFTSTSTEMIGRFVPKKDDVLMTIRVPKGYPHVDLAQNSEWTKEKELLLDAGTEFRVVDATPPGKIPRWQLTLEVVPRD